MEKQQDMSYLGFIKINGSYYLTGGSSSTPFNIVHICVSFHTTSDPAYQVLGSHETNSHTIVDVKYLLGKHLYCDKHACL